MFLANCHMTSVCSHVSLLLSACPPFSGTQHPCAASCLSLLWMLLKDRALAFVQHAVHCCPDAEGGMVLAASILVTCIGCAFPLFSRNALWSGQHVDGKAKQGSLCLLSGLSPLGGDCWQQRVTGKKAPAVVFFMAFLLMRLQPGTSPSQ